MTPAYKKLRFNPKRLAAVIWLFALVCGMIYGMCVDTNFRITMGVLAFMFITAWSLFQVSKK